MSYIMNEMAVKDIQEVLEKTKTAVIPVGVVEQHGYHLPLGTDTIRASEFVKRAADAGMNAVVLPVIPYCYSGGELAGTINVSPQIFTLLVVDIITELERIGFLHVVIFMGHGGTDNVNVLTSGIRTSLKKNHALRKMSVSIINSSKVSPLCRKYAQMTPEHDFHAGIVETSALMYLRPDLVKMDELIMDDEEVARKMRMDQDYFEKEVKVIDDEHVLSIPVQREEVKIGVMGFPEEASVELGRKITEEIAEGLKTYVNNLQLM